jgi:uncharacterized protein (DUF433 family)
VSITTHFPQLKKPAESPMHRLRLGRIRVAPIVADYPGYGWSVDEMCRQHDSLTQAEARAAMAYFDDLRAEIDAEILANLAEMGR